MNIYTFTVRAAVTVVADSVAEARQIMIDACSQQDEDVGYGPHDELSVYIGTPYSEDQAELTDEEELT